MKPRLMCLEKVFLTPIRGRLFWLEINQIVQRSVRAFLRAAHLAAHLAALSQSRDLDLLPVCILTLLKLDLIRTSFSRHFWLQNKPEMATSLNAELKSIKTSVHKPTGTSGYVHFLYSSLWSTWRQSSSLKPHCVLY